MSRQLIKILTLVCTLGVAASCSDRGAIVTPGQAPASFAPADFSNLKLVDGQLPFAQQVTYAIIGPEGGSIELRANLPDRANAPAHRLTVPAGVVKAPTYFVMEAPSSSRLEVELYAYDVATSAQITKFSKPLVLSLSYAAVPPGHRPDRFSIVYVAGESDTIKEKLSSSVDAVNEVVIAELRHFSRYCMAEE